MGGEAAPRLHGATDGEADLLQGGEEGMVARSSPLRQEENARVSSSRSHSAVASDASFRSSGTWSSSSFSSLASDVESDDDGDSGYPLTQCEYEEIPSFRWIASPLRWWKPKKGSDLSRKNAAHARTAIRDKEPGPLTGSWASESNSRLVHFEGYRTFRLEELLSASAEVLGKNTYCSLYKATLGDGSQVAVSRLRLEAIAKDFVKHAKLLGDVRHPNLLAPRAYYHSPNPSGEKLLMFDYMPKGNLSDFLHARGNSTPIGWPTRMNIAVGVARGLHHLHTQGNMVHGNLSSANVLLDCDVNAKIGGYGLSKLLTPAAASAIFMGMTSRSEYRAPELSNLNKMSTNTDVYSLGVVMLELLTGKSPTGLERTQWRASITKVETTAQPEFRDTLKLALKCVDVSPDERPEMQKVLQQLEHIKSKYEKTAHSPTTDGGNNPNEAGAEAASTITTASPATERATSPFKDNGIQTPWTSSNFANDGNLLQPCISENIVSSPLAFSSEAMPAPISSSQHKDENFAEMTPHGDLKDPEIPNPTHVEEISQNHFIDEELDALNPAEYITGGRMDTAHSPTTDGGNNPNDTGAEAASTITTASPATAERATSPFNDNRIQTPWTSSNFANDGNLVQPCISENIVSSPLTFSSEAMPAPISSSQHIDENFAEMTPYGDLNYPEIPNPTQAEEISQNPFADEELDALNPAEYITGRIMDTERCNAMSQGTGASPLSRIDWGTVDIQVRLHVPTSPPLITSKPDSVYQRYFQTLCDLAHRSPPLPGNVLEVQLNSMIMGLHSLGYPLDTWVNAANLVLILAKKKEYIEQHVDDYKVHVEMQLKEFTSAITPAKEEIAGTQSEITVLEQKQEKLDDTIVKLEDQLALLKVQRQEVAGSLATARDVLAVAEGKMESIFVRMDCLNQQYSAISNLRRAMLLELPSLDEIFDSTFQEITTKTF